MGRLVLLFFRSGDVSGAAIIWQDDLMLLAMVVVEGDAEFVRQGIDDGSPDAKSGKGAGAGHEGDFGEVAPSFAV